MQRSVAETELVELDDSAAILVEQRVLPWTPAKQIEHQSRGFEYTVGYSQGGRYTTFGISFSNDRSAIETELASVKAAIAQSMSDEPVTVLVLERPVLPWYPARPRVATWTR